MSSVLQTPEVSQLLGQNNVHRNLFPPQLVEAALRRGEAELAARGSSGGRDRQAYRPLAQRQVRGQGRGHRKQGRTGDR